MRQGTQQLSLGEKESITNVFSLQFEFGKEHEMLFSSLNQAPQREILEGVILVRIFTFSCLLPVFQDAVYSE